MEYKQALNKAAALCSRQERCADDIRKKFANWGFEDGDTEKAVKWLTDEKFIDDNRYAAYYVRDKFRFNGWGRIKIRWQLKQKNISSGIIEDALNSLDDSQYMDKLSELLTSKKKQIKNKDPWQTKAALVRFAQSRGYEPDIIFNALDRLTD